MIILTVLLVTLLAVEGREIVCSLSDWAQYRPGRGKFTLDDIDPTLCTIINYSFGYLDKTKLELNVKNKAFLESFTRKHASLRKKNPNLKIVLSMGGWGDSKDGEKYSRLVRIERNRRNFIKHAVTFLERYDFDGLDLNWEYPVCWHAKCNNSRKQESYYYGEFAQDLRNAFDQRELTLSASVSGSKYIIDRAYDVPALGRALHLINVLTYDFAGIYRGATGHHSAMHHREGDNEPHLNMDYAMKYWVQLGAPREKLTIGVPIFGRSFTLRDRSENELYAPIRGWGRPAEYTEEAGYMGYNEICHRVRNDKWIVKRVSRVGPYAFKADQWVSYDDPTSAVLKATYAREKGYAGVKIWEMSTDDFGGYCCGVKYPVLRALNYGLKKKGTYPGEEC